MMHTVRPFCKSSRPLFHCYRSSKEVYGVCYAFRNASAGAKAAATILPQTKANRNYIDTDAERLQKYACINFEKEGKNPELKPDAEYPKWLWELKLDGPAKLEELSPDTLEYWRRVRRLAKKTISVNSRLLHQAPFLADYLKKKNKFC